MANSVVEGGTEPSGSPFSFEENDRQTYYHNIRVFISGADVTPWITSNVVVQRSDRNAINRCSFTLSNQMRAFEITPENITVSGDKILANKFRTFDAYSAEGRYSELAKFTIFSIKNKQQVIHEVNAFGPVKGGGPGGKILTDKGTKRTQSSASADATLRYPMFPGSLVFHKYDPVRVFVQNPMRPKDDQWSIEFTGYIDTKPFKQNYVNGESMISVTCQDIRMLMQSMRTQNNPMANYGNENTLVFGGGPNVRVKDRAGAGLFNDLADPSAGVINHVLGGKTFLQTMDFLLLGFSGGSKVKDPKSDRNTNLGAIGNLKSGGSPVKYDVNGDEFSRKKTLEKWNNKINFGNYSTSNSGGFLTLIEMNTIGAGTYNGGPYSPDNALVHTLIPADGAPPNNIIQFIPDGQVEAKIEWGTRYELILQVVKGVDYQFYVSGTGDIIIEFPMYDFLPPEFNPVYNRLYSFYGHLIQDDVNDEGGQPITALIVTSTFLRGEIAAGNPQVAANNLGYANQTELKRTIFSNVLASRVGVHVETFNIPGVSEQNRLTQLGMIEFNKRMASYNKFSMSTSYRPYIGVNRPMYHKLKERLGITETVTYTYAIRDVVTLEMELGYTRKKEGNSFRFITGGERTPISYSTIYDKAWSTGNGVNSTPGGTTGKAVNSTGSGSKTN